MAHLSAWNVDANDITLGDLDNVDLDSFIVKTDEINEFLSHNGKSNKNFIVGPKGLGKTLLLKVKSSQLREGKNGKGFAFIPKKTLCERVSRPGVTFSIEDLNKFLTKDIWIKVWEVCLYTLILRRFEIALPSEISAIIGNATELSEIFANLLLDRKSIEKIYPLINSNLKPKVRDLEEYAEGVNQVAIFIDNIDEAFDDQIGIDEQIWVNAQISILTAVKNICSNNPHIKIYVSIRSEAYYKNQDPTRLQLDSRTIFLKYNKTQLRKIFYRNVAMLPKETLDKISSNDPITMLVGFNTIDHPFVIDVNGNPVQENLFDYIYRHTFGRPREIIIMGEAITKLENKTPDTVRRVVNDISYDLFNQLRREIIPYFNEIEFVEFCKLIKKNVFTNSTENKVSKEIQKKFNFEDFCSKLYSLGILGYVDSNDGKLVQKFLPVGQYTLVNEKIPDVESFVTHPATYGVLNRVHGNLRAFMDRNNIVGYDYPFHIRTDNRTLNHMHVGLDRDSLTIMIPELYKTKSLAIVLEPSQEWNELQTVNKFILTFNQRDELGFSIYRDNLLSSQKDALIYDWIHNQQHVIIYSNNRKVINDIFNNAHTISFCIPNENILKIINHSNDSNKICYYCQKVVNPSDFIKIKHTLKKFNPNYNLEKVLIDRFFYSRNSIIKDNALKYNLQAEEYGQLICSDREDSIMKPSQIVIRTKSPYELRFFELRNQLLSEGLYQFYKYLKQNTSITKYNEQGELFDLFISIQINRIFNEIELNRIRSIYQVDSKTELYDKLKKYSINVLNRIDELSKNYSTTGTTAIVDILKEKRIFPSDNDYYSFIEKNHSRYLNSELLQQLMNHLQIKPKPEFATVFISYSFIDAKFAEKIADRLGIFGIKRFLFGQDDPHRLLKKIMSEEIDKHDKVLFICSENSLKSVGCRFELSKCRLKYMSSWNHILVPIRIDNFIFQINKYDLPKNEQEEIWANIEHIKDSNVVDYESYLHTSVNSLFDSKLLKLIKDSFLK
ncbi:toll/interleukin-1 receptor domain-containing protein [Fibrella forsythiae]|uniref:Toll/interleukin-1 receptor domain-containing protein n=1 Tax=Fibrella forsythiae TaxID=2817061 RepID=A0ABS3JN39_9BACT|nr:toll/interleukin-1 receptor domain-containing protein [Fibrella forsythiae]MBO0950893.1 toll/interleukin-1 receptor domain-containing protein [Fibrella forsythiae]